MWNSRPREHVRVFSQKDVALRPWEPWATPQLKARRDIDTIVLPQQRKDAIMQDIGSFVRPARQQWYRERGIPYNRGYIFAGNPGTGKTSLVLAIAAHYEFDLYTLSLGDKTLNDAALASLSAAIPFRSILLLEDIDTVYAARTRKEEQQSAGTASITLSGLLNILDGAAASEGRLLFITSNYADDLDKALVRPGRCDMRCHFEEMCTDTMIEFFSRMYRRWKNNLTVGRARQGQLARACSRVRSTMEGQYGPSNSSAALDAARRRRGRCGPFVR